MGSIWGAYRAKACRKHSKKIQDQNNIDLEQLINYNRAKSLNCTKKFSNSYQKSPSRGYLWPASAEADAYIRNFETSG